LAGKDFGGKIVLAGKFFGGKNSVFFFEKKNPNYFVKINFSSLKAKHVSA
jgi:hypothetical protein